MTVAISIPPPQAFCGQTQPHAAHIWHPIASIGYAACGGLIPNDAFQDANARRIVDAVQALIAEYRKVSPSPSHLVYLRDFERVFDPSLPLVVDADQRKEWP